MAMGKKAPAKSFDAPWNKKLIGSPLLNTSMKLADITPSEIKGIRDKVNAVMRAKKLIPPRFMLKKNTPTRR